MSSTTPTSISASGNVYTLGIGLSGTPTGGETLTVNPASNSIYDAYSNISTISQSNNTVTVNDKTPPTITMAVADSDGNLLLYDASGLGISLVHYL